MNNERTDHEVLHVRPDTKNFMRNWIREAVVNTGASVDLYKKEVWSGGHAFITIKDAHSNVLRRMV